MVPINLIIAQVIRILNLKLIKFIIYYIGGSSYSKRFDSTNNESEDRQECRQTFLGIMAFVSSIVLIISCGMYYIGRATSEKHKPLDSTNLLMKLKTEFENQSKSFHSNLISCYEESILKQHDPSIVMLVSDKPSLDCVAKKLLRVLNEAAHPKINFQNLIIDTKILDRDPNTAKLQLDTKLTNIFSNLNAKLTLIEDILKIPPESMMIFYAYGDEASNSKSKGVIILLTYTLEKVISEEEYKKLSNDYSMLSRLVEKELNTVWSETIDYDQLNPLFSRIANNIILVNNDESCEYKTL